MESVEILKEARSLIEQGWTRGEYFKGGRCCTLGAVAKATDPEVAKQDPDAPLWRDSAQAALKLLNNVYLSGNFTGHAPDEDEYNLEGTVRFDLVNDAQKTKKPVLQWFDDAIKLAEEA